MNKQGPTRRETEEPVRETITELRSRKDLPERGDELVFDAPWQARAFGVVVALYRRGVISWDEFQQRLIEEIQDDSGPSILGDAPKADVDGAESRYYRQWMSAFVDWLLDNEIVTEAELETRTAEFAAGERDASEFVIGEDPHDHDHDHHG